LVPSQPRWRPTRLRRSPGPSVQNGRRSWEYRGSALT